MVKFYKLIIEYQGRHNDIVCRSGEMYGIGEYDFLEGKIINKWDERFSFFYDPDEGNIPTDYLANDLGWLLLSTKLKKIFDDLCIEGVQYFPVNIINIKDNSQLDGYHVCNIYTHIDALDLDNSDYTYFELDDERILSIKKYALKSSELKGRHLIKLQSETIPTFVSEAVKQKIQEEAITGCTLLEVKVT